MSKQASRVFFCGSQKDDKRKNIFIHLKRRQKIQI